MFSTTLGLSAVALRGDPAMKVLSAADVSAGLPAPSAAAALLGKGGAAALLVLLFLAVTSATSAELIAVSSILTFDVYKVSRDRSEAVWVLMMVFRRNTLTLRQRSSKSFGYRMHRYELHNLRPLDIV